MGGWNEPPRLRPLRRLRRFVLMGAATPPLPRRGVPFGCFATFIEKSAHPEFLEVRRSDCRKNVKFSAVLCTIGTPTSRQHKMKRILIVVLFAFLQSVVIPMGFERLEEGAWT